MPKWSWKDIKEKHKVNTKELSGHSGWGCPPEIYECLLDLNNRLEKIENQK